MVKLISFSFVSGIDSGTQGARCDTSKNVNEETVAVDGLNATKAGDAGTAGKTSNLTNDASKGKLLKVPEGILKRKSGEIPYLLKSGKVNNHFTQTISLFRLFWDDHFLLFSSEETCL